MLSDPLYRFLAGLLGLVLLIGSYEGTYFWGHHKGVEAQKAVYAAEQVKARDAVHKLENKGGVITQQVKTDNVQKQTEIRWRTKYLTNEVTKYVTQEADTHCVVTRGFVSLYNQAAAPGADPTVPGAPGGPVDAPSDVPLSAVSSTDVFNLGVGHSLLAEVVTWRTWYAAQRAAWEAQRGMGAATSIAAAPSGAP